jgi:protocatechuate 3,4-dioxygenase beta subunit
MLTSGGQSMGRENFRIYGTVTDARGRPVEGVRVRAWDRDWWSADDELGEALTDAGGRFRILFARAAFSTGVERRPDLYLVVEDTGSGRPLASTRGRVRWWASREEWFELHLRDTRLEHLCTLAGSPRAGDLSGILR